MQNNYLLSLDNLTRTDPTVIAASQSTSGSARRYENVNNKFYSSLHYFLLLAFNVYPQNSEQFERF